MASMKISQPTRDTLAAFSEDRPFSHLYGNVAIAADDPRDCEKPQTLIAFMHYLKYTHPSIQDLLTQTGVCLDLERALQIRIWLDDNRETITDLPWLKDVNPADPGKLPLFPPEAIRLKSLNPFQKSLVLASFFCHNEKYAREAFASPDFIQPEHKFDALLLAVWYSNNVPLFHELRKLPHDKVLHEDFYKYIFSPEKPSERIPLYQELSTIPELRNSDLWNAIEGFLRLNDAANHMNRDGVDAYLSQGVVQPYYYAIQFILNSQASGLDDAYSKSMAIQSTIRS